MTEPVILLLVGALLLQLPLGVVMYFDAKRLGLKDPEVYWLGVVVPTVGFVVILYYFSERKDLPKKDDPDQGGSTR
ncbi:hypothetical protein [Halobellus limi]|uniref:Negative regulatory protein YxlE n=1 Tax=Halobellus limi TaxID=699433 RepID=A0A1H5TFN2_9EURY|nr:hypothetical protein [Halobellus limi]QCC47324.1 hypothetical protein DV707_06415 [Halobellus limi]SEF61574.1 hypothetical protein SAMN04488133_0264 [Halobellus limi]